MIALPNQPFDFGYSQTCECGQNDYEQFFFDTDVIQAAFEIEKCENSVNIQITSDDFDSFSGAVTNVGNTFVFAGNGQFQILLPTHPTGYYLVRIQVLNYTSGTFEFQVSELGKGTFTQDGIIEIWVNILDTDTTIQIEGFSAFGTIDGQIELIQYPTNHQLFLMSGNTLIQEFEKFYREDKVVFELNLALLSLTDCIYKLGWIDECDPYSFDNPVNFSNDFKIIDPDNASCTVALSGCFPGTQLGFPADFLPLVRVSGRLAQPQYAGEIIKSRDSQGYTRINYADRIKTMQLKLNLIPEYILDFISVWIAFEQMYINGQSYRITDESFPEVLYPDGSDLGQLDLTVERVRQNIVRKSCNDDVSPCEEVPPPPNLGVGKLFQDGEDFEFQDEEIFLFQ